MPGTPQIRGTVVEKERGVDQPLHRPTPSDMVPRISWAAAAVLVQSIDQPSKTLRPRVRYADKLYEYEKTKRSQYLFEEEQKSTRKPEMTNRKTFQIFFSIEKSRVLRIRILRSCYIYDAQTPPGTYSYVSGDEMMATSIWDEATGAVGPLLRDL